MRNLGTNAGERRHLHLLRDPYVFGRPGPKDRDYYAREVKHVDVKPAGILTLEVTLTLACGHQMIGKAHAEHRRVPHVIFCRECHEQACKETTEKLPLAPSRAKAQRRRATRSREAIATARGKHANENITT